MRLWAIGLVVLLSIRIADAAEKPVIGAPLPGWVNRVSFDPQAPVDTQPVRLILLDQQIRFPEAGEEIYTHSVVRVGSTEGLSIAGNVNLSWNPETDTLSVHRLVVHRGQETLDVLAKQNFTTLRRESNLEYAMLDGVLTATLQIEGLAVGDILEVETTLTSNNPLMAGHAEHAEFGLGSIDHMLLRASWPASRKIRWRGLDEFADVVPTTQNGETEFRLDLHPLAPIQLPKGAPTRYLISHGVEFAEFDSWAEASALMSPLYAKATTLAPDSPLRAEIDRIRKTSPDPKQQAAQALAFVESKVRYLYVGLDLGGLKPADADTTWRRRFGDCKGKTALLLALLNGLGIEAQPVLINTLAGDALPDRLPAVSAFNHVMVRATIAGKSYWLDGTRQGDTSLDLLETPAFHWGLPVQAAGAELVALMPAALASPEFENSLQLDASDGDFKNVKAHAEARIHGDGAFVFHNAYTGSPASERDKNLRQYWRNSYDFITPKAVSEQYDPASRTLTLKLDGLAELNWRSQQTVQYVYIPDAGLGYDADLEREPGPHSDAPYANEFPTFDTHQVTIKLPDNGKGFYIQGGDVDTTIANVAYKRTTRLANGEVVMTASSRALAPEFPASEAATAKRALQDMSDVAMLLLKTSASKGSLSTAADYVARARTKAGSGDRTGALKDIEAAIKLDPTYPGAYSNRGMLRVASGELEEARNDFQTARSLGLKDDPTLEQGEAMVDLGSGKPEDAIKHLNAVLNIDSELTVAVYYRGLAEISLERYDAALSDADELNRKLPSSPLADALKLSVHLAKGDLDAAIALDNKAVAAAPKSPAGYWTRGAHFLLAGKLAEADADFDKAVDLSPSVESWLQRADMRAPRNTSERRKDIDAALKINPNAYAALRAAVENESMAGDVEKARSFAVRLLELDPKEPSSLIARAGMNFRAGKVDQAKADFAAARKESMSDAIELNNLCWAEATLGADLETALSDCNASLALRRLAATLDSRALVELRLGRFDDALKDYDEAINRSGGAQAASLFGRAIVKSRKGDASGAERDFTKARRAAPMIDQRFESFGLRP